MYYIDAYASIRGETTMKDRKSIGKYRNPKKRTYRSFPYTKIPDSGRHASAIRRTHCLGQSDRKGDSHGIYIGIGGDSGYFGEKLASAHQVLQATWQKRSARLACNAQRTDILGTLMVAGQMFQCHPPARDELIIFLTCGSTPGNSIWKQQNPGRRIKNSRS